MAVPQKHPSYINSADEGAGTNTISIVTEEIVAANPDRQYLYIKNLDSTIIVSLGFGENAVSLKGVVLAGGEVWEMPHNSMWTGAIDAIAASGTPTIAFVEW